MVARRTTGVTWVIYRMTVKGAATGANAVCTRAEWDEMEAARPGHYPLLRADLASLTEAERLARGTSGDPVKHGEPRPAPGPAEVPPAPAHAPPAHRTQSRKSNAAATSA